MCNIKKSQEWQYNLIKKIQFYSTAFVFCNSHLTIFVLAKIHNPVTAEEFGFMDAKYYIYDTTIYL